MQHKVSPEFPSFYSQGYLHDKAVGKEELTKLDAANRKSLDAYLENIHTMERLTRLNVNLALLKKHLAQNQAAGKPTFGLFMVCPIWVGRQGFRRNFIGCH